MSVFSSVFSPFSPSGAPSAKDAQLSRFCTCTSFRTVSFTSWMGCASEVKERVASPAPAPAAPSAPLFARLS